MRPSAQAHWPIPEEQTRQSRGGAAYVGQQINLKQWNHYVIAFFIPD